MTTAYQMLATMHECCSFQTREGTKCGRASKSELRRWIKNRAFIINGEAVDPDEELDFPIISVILFPTSPRKVTLW